MKFAIAIAIAVLLFTTSVRLESQTEGETISLGMVALSIGMDQETVKQLLLRHYELKPIRLGPSPSSGPNESLLVWNGTSVGNVAFQNGRLTSVFKYWNSDGGQERAAEYAQKFYGAVKSLTSGGPRTCVLDTASSIEPSIEQRTVFIACGQRTLRVLVVRDGKSGLQANLSEQLK